MYNYHLDNTVDNKLCPVIWGVKTPSVTDWQQLESYLGMQDISELPGEVFQSQGSNQLKINGITNFNAIFAGGISRRLLE